MRPHALKLRETLSVQINADQTRELKLGLIALHLANMLYSMSNFFEKDKLRFKVILLLKTVFLQTKTCSPDRNEQSQNFQVRQLQTKHNLYKAKT